MKCSLQKEEKWKVWTLVQLVLEDCRINTQISCQLYKKCGSQNHRNGLQKSVFHLESASDVKHSAQVCVSGPASACPGSACFSAGKSSQHPTGLEREAEQREAFFSGPCTWTWRWADSQNSHPAWRSLYSPHWSEPSSSQLTMGDQTVLGRPLETGTSAPSGGCNSSADLPLWPACSPPASHGHKARALSL